MTPLLHLSYQFGQQIWRELAFLHSISGRAKNQHSNITAAAMMATSIPGPFPIRSRNPIPLSAAQEGQVRDRRYCLYSLPIDRNLDTRDADSWILQSTIREFVVTAPIRSVVNSFESDLDNHN